MKVMSEAVERIISHAHTLTPDVRIIYTALDNCRNQFGTIPVQELYKEIIRLEIIRRNNEGLL